MRVEAENVTYRGEVKKDQVNMLSECPNNISHEELDEALVKLSVSMAKEFSFMSIVFLVLAILISALLCIYVLWVI